MLMARRARGVSTLGERAAKEVSHGWPDRSPVPPATLSKKITTDLLRGKLGFNGLTITDASHMVGITGRMACRDFLPGAVAAGCDMFMFFNDPEEDLAWMMEGYRVCVITEGRLAEGAPRTPSCSPRPTRRPSRW